MKKILTLCLCAVLMFSLSVNCFARGKVKNVYVGSAPTKETEEVTTDDEIEASEENFLLSSENNTENLQSKYVLSLENAIQMAVKDNPQFLDYDVSISDARLQIEKAKKDIRDNKNLTPKLPSGIEIVVLQQGYYQKQAELALEMALSSKEQALSKLSYNVTQQYYNTKLAQSLLECAKAAYQIASDNKKTIDMRYELGQVSELDAKNAELALLSAHNSLSSCERQLGLAMDNLKLLLQIENSDAELLLTDGIEFEEFKADIESDIQKAINSRYDLSLVRNTYESAVLYSDIVSVAYSKYTNSSANKNVSQAKYNYTNALKNIRILIKSYYNDVLTANENLSLAASRADLVRREYEVTNLKVSLGLATNSELTQKMNEVSTANMDYERAKLSYKLAVQKYNYEISIGL